MADSSPSPVSLAVEALQSRYSDLVEHLRPEVKRILDEWQAKKDNYSGDEFSYEVRGKTIKVSNFIESLSHSLIPKIAVPKFHDWGEVVR